MAAKEVVFGGDARTRMVEGVNIPPTQSKSRSARKAATWCSVASFGAPTVTKDGVSVAKEVRLRQALANMGAQMVKEVSQDLRQRR